MLVPKRILLIILSVLLVLPVLCFGTGAEGLSDEYVSARDRLFERGLLESESGNADWFALVLAAEGKSSELSEYAYLVLRRTEGNIERNDRVRTALLCHALGIAPDFVQETVNDSSLDLVSELIWRLVIASGLGDTALCDALSEELCSRELKTGGFALGGEQADPDMTAMAVCALSLAGKETDSLLTVLSELQNESGGYTSLGYENAESAAQVVTALCTVGIDPENDERFIKNGVSVLDSLMSFSLGAGFRHIKGTGENDRATVQAALALLALKKGEKIFDFDGVSVVPQAPSSDTKENEALNYKPIAVGLTALCAAVSLCVLAVLHRLNKKRLVLILAAALAISLFFALTDIKTPDRYYAENPDPITDRSETVTLSVVGDDTLIPPTKYALREGESALDLLLRAAKYNKVRVDEAGGYVRGIGGLYELDKGSTTGWTVRINGEYPSVGASSVILKNGDTVEWIYGDLSALRAPDAP